MPKKTLIVLALIAALALSMTPAIIRTVDTIDDAYALTVLATSDANHISLNPYGDEGALVSPAMAAWLLKSFDFPYRSCHAEPKPDHCGTPLIAWVGRGLDLADEAATERGYGLLAHFLERGEPLDVVAEDGLAPVHEAILYRNSRYLRILLEAGADTSIRIDQAERPADGLNAWQFLDLLESQKAADFSDVRAVMDQY